MNYTTASGRRIPLAPPEGWLTLGLVLLLCLSLAWSLDDAQLVLGDPELTDFLTWTAVFGVAAGFIGAMVGWGRWRTIFIGVLFAALITPLLVGWVLEPEGPFGILYRSTASEVVQAWRDLIVLDHGSTVAFGHHLLLLGLIVWGSSMFAAYAAFGHRRPLNAVLLIGTLLIANMALTTRGQLPYLVLYTLASLFLLIRFHTVDEQADWVRRRIGDPSAISGMYLRGGTIFIVATVLGSLLLTQAASSAPLAGAWTQVGGRVIEWSQFLQKYLPISGSGRSIGPSFGSTASIGGVWSSDEGVALTWESPTVLDHPPYLAAVVYDDFTLRAWRYGDTVGLTRARGKELLADTADAVAPDGRTPYTVTVSPTLSRSLVYTPEMPLNLSMDATVQLVSGEDGYLAQLERATSSDPYSVTALIRASEKDGGATINKLRVAGQDYPAGMLEEYGSAAVPEGTFTTPEAKALLEEFASSDANPYDLSASIVRTLQDPSRFQYSTDVRGHRCDLSIVDCFATFHDGYCEYYATTMAMILRSLDIPARIVEGYLPGKKVGPGNRWEVRNSDSHAWVQVFFPGYGWIDFDPTGGSRSSLAPLPTGAVQGSPSPRASSKVPRATLPEATFRDINEPGGAVDSNRRPPIGPFIVAAVLLAVIVGALALVAWRRGPRGPVSADGAYGMVTRFASRFGFAPRPNQTVYEYANALAEILPEARPQLELVARSKVEVSYGGRRLGTDRIIALREAQRRLRTSLLRLALHRRQRPRRRR